MRTKTILAAAAFIAVGVLASKAQNVYSLNIVGYVNIPVGSLTAIANPLRSGPSGEVDRADHVVPYSEGDTIQVWTGVSWKAYSMDSLSSSGWTDDGGDVDASSLPILGPGVGFFYGNNSGISQITLVGEVRTGANAVTLPPGLTPTGSSLPYSGNISTGSVGLDVQDGDVIQTWTGAAWKAVTRDELSDTGWIDDNGDAAEPTLAVGQAFFYLNNGASFNWVQELNP